MDGFVQVSPDSVRVIGETVGISNMGPTVSRALAEDVSYRVRELAHVSDAFLIIF